MVRLAQSLEAITIAVLCGGPGPEREVSLDSGAQILQGLRDAGLQAERVVIAGNAADVRRLKCDLAFIAVHGEFGEDGVLQHLLTAAGIPFTGSDAACCGLTIDKVLTKKALAASDIPVPKGIAVTSPAGAIEATASGNLRYPVFVKPASCGSSVGTSIAHTPTMLEEAIICSQTYDKMTIIEEAIVGSELAVGFLAGEILPIIQLSTDHAFYDYAAKYEDDETRYLCPAPLPAEVAAAVRTLAGRAFAALQVKDFARADFMLGAEGPRILEVNTIPGFTRHSLLPMAATAAGIDFPELCRKIVALAWQRAQVGAMGR